MIRQQSTSISLYLSNEDEQSTHCSYNKQTLSPKVRMILYHVSVYSNRYRIVPVM